MAFTLVSTTNAIVFIAIYNCFVYLDVYRMDDEGGV